MTTKIKVLISILSVAAIVTAITLLAKGKSKDGKNDDAKNNSNDKIDNPETTDPELVKKFNFHLIPDGKNNYRSAQITADELPSVIKKYGIKHIIRLNGDNSDSKHKESYPSTSLQDEKKICEQNGCEFHQIDAHSGYSNGKGYVGSMNKALPILANGNTLVHCAHGADRTGYMVAAHLKATGKMVDKDDLWKYTTQYNGWQKKVDKGTFFGSGYDKYADAFYPIEELKNSKWNKK